MKLSFMLLLFPGCLLWHPAPAATITVPADQPTIQAGIDAAINGDTVLVAAGTYTGAGNKNIDYSGKQIVLISQNNDAENCIIDCENSGRGFYFHMGEDSTTLLNFTSLSSRAFLA